MVSMSGRSLGELTIGDLAIELGSVRAQIVQRRLGEPVIVTGTGVLVSVAAAHPAHHENHRQRTGEQ
jgi:hypothetical protein